MGWKDTHADIFERHTRQPVPFGWLQWKGTSVCMDLHCVCGFHSHFDAEFTYYIRCPKCRKPYSPSGFIQMVPLTAGEAAVIEKEANGFVEAEERKDIEVDEIISGEPDAS